MLAEREGYMHISTGDLVRNEIRLSTQLGKEIQSIVESGRLVDDRTVSRLLEKAIEEGSRHKGIIFDGFPRNIQQAKVLDSLLGKQKLSLDSAVFIDVSKETVISRLSSRRQCTKCNAVYNLNFNKPKAEGKCDKCSAQLYRRKDDSEAVIKNRFEVFENETRPLIEYYKKECILKHVSGEGTAEQNLSALLEALRLEG